MENSFEIESSAAAVFSTKYVLFYLLLGYWVSTQINKNWIIIIIMKSIN
jgi:hypothetical protein